MMFANQDYNQTLVRLALPIVGQYVISAAMGLLDIMMVGQLGDSAVAAVGLANQIWFLYQLALFGINSGCGLFAAQYWGKRDISSIHKVQGINLVVALITGGFFLMVVEFAPETVLGFYTNDPEVIALGARYLKISGAFYLFVPVSFVFATTLRATENVRLPTIIASVILSLKTLLNYGLIFGNLGMPNLGVLGAAYAMSAAQILMCLMLVGFTYKLKLPAAARLSELLAFDKIFLFQVLKTSLPVMGNEILWSTGITMYSAIYAHINTEAIAAVNINSSIEYLAIVVFMGITDATAIMVGNRIGAGEEKIAVDYSRRSLWLNIAGSIIIGAIVILLREPILSVYKISAETRSNAISLLLVFSLTLWVRSANMMLIVGVLRSGGDTRFCFLLDGMGVWLVGIPLAYTGAFLLNLPVYLVYLMVAGEEVVKLGLAYWRFSSRRWLRNLTNLGANT